MWECETHKPAQFWFEDIMWGTDIIRKIMPDIIDLKNEFIMGRQGFHNIRRVLNIIHNYKEKTDAVLLSVDGEKPFDKVKWANLFAPLERFGFGSNFRTWI